LVLVGVCLFQLVHLRGFSLVAFHLKNEQKRRRRLVHGNKKAIRRIGMSSACQVAHFFNGHVNRPHCVDIAHLKRLVIVVQRRHNVRDVVAGKVFDSDFVASVLTPDEHRF
tara:strand:- start:1087 stop:1419 length:333 start_codon:yes stop_codon:yes gene_type:complete